MILVKLWQFDMADHVRVDTNKMRPCPMRPPA